MLLSFFQLSLAVRNVWPGRMGLKAFIVLYLSLLLAGMPIKFLSCIPYGLFGIPGLWKAQNAFPRKQQFPELPAAKQRRQVEQQNMNHMDNGRNIRLLDRITHTTWKPCITACAPLSTTISIFYSPCPAILN